MATFKRIGGTIKQAEVVSGDDQHLDLEAEGQAMLARE
jgi:hypothetical protein